MAMKVPLVEDIVQRLTDMFRRNPAYEVPPEVDSAIETRRESGDSVHTSRGGTYDWYADETTLETKRKKKYKEYERMDTEAVEIASALDIYADNATSGDREENESIEIVSESETVIEVLGEVKRRLQLDSELWSIARELVKYGDCFEEVVVHDDLEVHRIKHLAPARMRVVEDTWGRLDPEFPYEQTTDTGEIEAKFRDWQILHFLLKKDRTSKYGVDGSVLYPIRKVFKQLSMMEDGVVIARLTRAQQRYAFMIDVTGIEPGQPTQDYLRETKKELKKKRTIDPSTGKMDLRYNPMSAEEDIFLAKREGSGSDVKILQGAGNLGQLADVEYFSKKLFAGLKVPKAWMGFEGETHARAVITELDVQFAKTERRVQQALIAGLRKLFDFVLVTRGIDPVVHEYTVRLPIMSAIDELREWQMEAVKAEIAKKYRNELGVSTEWVYRNMLDLTDVDIAEIKTSLENDDSLDNVRAQRDIAYANALKPQVIVANPAPEPDDEASGKKVIKKATDPVKDVPVKDVAGAGVSEHKLSAREIRLMKHSLETQLDSLYELLDWEFEEATGRKLTRKPVSTRPWRKRV